MEERVILPAVFYPLAGGNATGLGRTHQGFGQHTGCA